MIRTITKQGNGSMQVTLPISWARKQGLNKSSKVEMVESGDCIIIGPSMNRAKRKIAIDIDNVDAAARKIIASLYRSGYDEILVKYDSPIVRNHIKEVVWELTGYEVEQVKGDVLLIKDIADLDPETFDTMFKKCFLILTNFCSEIIHYFENKNMQGLSNTIVHDGEINRLTNLCQRLLNKKMNDRRKISIYAIMLKNIEKIADEMKEIVQCSVMNKKLPSNPKLRELKEIHNYLKEVYSLYFNKYDLGNLARLNQKLRDNLSCTKNDADISKFYHPIISRMTSLLEGPIALRSE